MMSKTYLGNGLYAEWDGEQLKLWTERGNGRHYVYLNAEVLRALQDWLKTRP